MKKKQKPLPKKPVVILAAVTLCIIFIAVFSILKPAAPVIGFYDIPEISIQSITSLARDSTLAGNTKFEIRRLDADKPLQAQLVQRPKVSLLFIAEGKAAIDVSSMAIAPPEAIRSLMPQAMRQAGRTDGKAYGIPLQLDHFEVAYNMAAFRMAKISRPKTVAELLAAAGKIKKTTRWPILCAGAQDDDLFLLVGSLAEALGGLTAWEDLSARMMKENGLKETIAGGTLRNVLDELIRWRSAGLLHPEWFRMKGTDVSGFMEGNYAGIVLMPLSAHRLIPQAAIEKFASMPFPPAQAESERSVTAPATLGILIGRKKAEKNSVSFLENLAKADGQKKLTGMTGLAPVNSTAETADRQAADVRLWAASSQKPLPGIGTAAFSDSEKRKQFAQELRLYIEVGGAGY